MGWEKVLISVLPVIFLFLTVEAHIDIGKSDHQNETRKLTKRQSGGAGCNYNFQFQNPGDSGYLTSPNYPGDYTPNVDCRYTITSPVGTTMKLDCTEFNLESSTNCQYDVFFMSLTGDQTFSDQEFYCGAGTLTKTTKSNKLAIGFHSDDSNPLSTKKYLFRCLITVSPISPAPTPSCSCGIRNDGASGRIVGGTTASVGEFPWRCALYTPKNQVFCGCTIISANWVLTAAHCTRNVASDDQIYVDVGDHDLASTTDSSSQELIPVSRIIENALYNDQTQDSDSSLLRLSKPLIFSRNVSPVCLPWKFVATDLNGANVVASGWGTQFFAGPTSNVLKKVDLKVVGTNQCRQTYMQKAVETNSTPIPITDNMICTFTPGKDTCQGDSGGSIDFNSGGRYYAVGIVSQGVGCGSDHPGVYTKISNFLTWIQGNTGENFCKI